MFRYLALRKLCDATFVWFLLSWFVTRHVLFIIVIKSVYTDLPKAPLFVWIPERGCYLSDGIWVGFIAMLSALQVRNQHYQRAE
jgi:very-long-chain ceramide synthase